MLKEKKKKCKICIYKPKTYCVCSYDRAKQRYSRNREEKLSPGLHLASAAEAGGLVSVLTHTIMTEKNKSQSFELCDIPALFLGLLMIVAWIF